MSARHAHSFVFDGDVLFSVIEAVAWVNGVDVTELRPLEAVIDVEAFEALIESAGETEVAVSFGYEQTHVQVNSRGTIVIERRPASGREVVDGAANVLYLIPEAAHLESDGCAELSAISPPDAQHVLYVQFESSARDAGAGLANLHPEPVANAALVSVGGFTRSAASRSSTGRNTPGVLQYDAIPDPGDLSTLGVTLNGWLAAWDGDGYPIVMCFDTLADLLDEVDLLRAFRFLQLLTARVRSVDGVAHYHLDPARCGDEVIGTLSPLFDATVSIDGSGELVVDAPD